MATCKHCGREYDPDEVEYEYDNDWFISSHDLEGTYGNFYDCCADCAISEAKDAYPTGVENLGYLGDDD